MNGRGADLIVFLKSVKGKLSQLLLVLGKTFVLISQDFDEDLLILNSFLRYRFTALKSFFSSANWNGTFHGLHVENVFF